MRICQQFRRWKIDKNVVNMKRYADQSQTNFLQISEQEYCLFEKKSSS